MVRNLSAVYCAREDLIFELLAGITLYPFELLECLYLIHEIADCRCLCSKHLPSEGFIDPRNVSLCNLGIRSAQNLICCDDEFSRNEVFVFCVQVGDNRLECFRRKRVDVAAVDRVQNEEIVKEIHGLPLVKLWKRKGVGDAIVECVSKQVGNCFFVASGEREK